MSNANANALTVISENAQPIDVWSEAASEASPVLGTNVLFNSSAFFTRDKTQIGPERKFAVTGRIDGWQKLEAGCPAEYLVRQPGGPKPAQPHVPETEWKLNLSGQPEHPWRWTTYIHMVDIASGETLTFSSSTVGGGIGVRELTDQIVSMRRMQPDAVPVVKLGSKPFKTAYGPKPRPAFEIVGWKNAAPVDPEPELIEAQPDFDDPLDELLNS